MAFIQSVTLPKIGCAYASTGLSTRQTARTTSSQRLVIKAAKHAQLKVTKEHERRRPRKHRPSDINRKPPPYNPEPERAEGYVYLSQSLFGTTGTFSHLRKLRRINSDFIQALTFVSSYVTDFDAQASPCLHHCF